MACVSSIKVAVGDVVFHGSQ